MKVEGPDNREQCKMIGSVVPTKYWRLTTSCPSANTNRTSYSASRFRTKWYERRPSARSFKPTGRKLKQTGTENNIGLTSTSNQLPASLRQLHNLTLCRRSTTTRYSPYNILNFCQHEQNVLICAGVWLKEWRLSSRLLPTRKWSKLAASFRLRSSDMLGWRIATTRFIDSVEARIHLSPRKHEQNVLFCVEISHSNAETVYMIFCPVRQKNGTNW